MKAVTWLVTDRATQNILTPCMGYLSRKGRMS